MKKPIALVTRIDRADEQAWVAILASLLPESQIVHFHEMDDAQRDAAEIAIVANPDPGHVAALPNLKWIHSLWAGVERLVAELGQAAPPIVRLEDPELARVMAEAILAWTYYLHRDMPAYRRQQAAAIWRQHPYRRPVDLTVGILGMGLLGKAAAGKLTAAGFRVTGWARSPQQIDGVDMVSAESGLDRLLRTSDIVVSLLPLTSETRGLLDARRLSSMKTGARLINFSRGPIIVDVDLIAALDAGHIAHAVLDVFDAEPLPPTSPYWRHDSVTVLPHISAPTDRNTAAVIVADNINRYYATGALPAAIDIKRGY
ncbi:2-hydroxyacid dehydrogenase [Ensifer canadensis]